MFFETRLILFGLIAISVANEQIILHPFEVPNVIPHLYVICGFLLLFVSIGSCLFPAWITLIIVGLILTLLAIIDSQQKLLLEL